MKPTVQVLPIRPSIVEGRKQFKILASRNGLRLERIPGKVLQEKNDGSPFLWFHPALSSCWERYSNNYTLKPWT